MAVLETDEDIYYDMIPIIVFLQYEEEKVVFANFWYILVSTDVINVDGS